MPARRHADDSQVKRGSDLFDELSCHSCHTRSYTTGDYAISALARQKIYPYTDLLLHDMGEALADNRPDYRANGREWRTLPCGALDSLRRSMGTPATFTTAGLEI